MLAYEVNLRSRKEAGVDGRGNAAEEGLLKHARDLVPYHVRSHCRLHTVAHSTAFDAQPISSRRTTSCRPVESPNLLREPAHEPCCPWGRRETFHDGMYSPAPAPRDGEAWRRPGQRGRVPVQPALAVTTVVSSLRPRTRRARRTYTAPGYPAYRMWDLYLASAIYRGSQRHELPGRGTVNQIVSTSQTGSDRFRLTMTALSSRPPSIHATQDVLGETAPQTTRGDRRFAKGDPNA